MSSSVVGENRGDQQFQRISSRLKPSGLVEITGRVLEQSCAGENQRRQKKRLFYLWSALKLIPSRITSSGAIPRLFQAPAVSGDVGASEDEFSNGGDE